MVASLDALHLPELVLQILQPFGLGNLGQRIQGRPVLAAAARVDRVWFEQATTVLWVNPFDTSGETRCYSAFLEMPVERRQYYASKIKVLELSQVKFELEAPSFLKGLRFPRLKEIEIGNDFRDPSHDWLLPSISHCLHPHLEAITIGRLDGVLTKEFLEELNTKCPRLKEFNIAVSNLTGSHITPDEFLNFLVCHSSLETISGHLSQVITNEVLLHLSHSKVRHLNLSSSRTLEGEDLQEILKLNPLPFENLQIVFLRLPSSSAIYHAVSVFRNVTKMTLIVEDNSVIGIRHLTALVHLENLYVSFPDDVSIEVNELLALRSLSRLHSLGLVIWDYSASILHITDAEFDSLISAFPLLTYLDLEVVACNSSVSMLLSLSKHCTLIEDINLNGSYDLEPLSEIKTPLFLHLRSLNIRPTDTQQYDAPRHLTGEETVRILREHAPRLLELDTVYGDVTEAFEELLKLEGRW